MIGVEGDAWPVALIVTGHIQRRGAADVPHEVVRDGVSGEVLVEPEAPGPITFDALGQRVATGHDPKNALVRV